MVNVVLVHPQIPQNTGNIARLCAGTNTRLHLVGELGFSLEDRYLKRAGLDYWPHVDLQLHDTLDEALKDVDPGDVGFYSSHAKRSYLEFEPAGDPWLVFGREADGLPPEILQANQDRTYKVPINNNVRSLNLGNCCAVVLYEALRRRGFPLG